MTAEGRERLGASGAFDAIVDAQITDLIHDDGEAEKLGEFVERLTDGGVHTASPENIVNRLANGSRIQIEQALAVRERCWSEIADAVASVYRRILARES